ncbi:copper resistance D domain protein [Hirschia baltica ATCC 49814]|uniref:Copper resistance D domain protein n=1 Tax=Hirschia baltica (strain ATCC 49814 / DSM 5838 / IFAM 1418) TaxID=582402 RepID=C6XPA9_HIRBI|nr:copper resistance D domain protein [Hirschia baltica ATCC 49814]
MLTLLVLFSKFGLYLTALIGLGAALHSTAAIVISRRWFVILGLGLVIAVSLRLALLNAQLAGGLSAAFSPDTFSWIWTANRYQAMAYLAGGGLIAASSLVPLKYLKLPAAIFIAAGFGLGGHTQGLDMPGLAPWFASGHVLIAGFWIVAPFTLWPRASLDADLVHFRMERFSKIALWCVPILFVSGIWLALRLAGSGEAILSSSYGQLLLTKLLLATLALAIGAWNKLRITQLLKNDAPSGVASLKRSLGADILVFAGILLVIAAATTLTGPGAV